MPALFEQLKNRMNNRFRRWVRKRQGEDGATVTLNRRRIYILPSKSGLVFAAMLFIMLLAAMNYSNSLGFALTFLLAGLGFLAMHQCHATLDGLQIKSGRIKPVFAGHHAVFTLQIINQRTAPRLALHLQANNTPDNNHHKNGRQIGAYVDLPGYQADMTKATVNHGVLRINLPTFVRGYQSSGRLRLGSNHPFGLFQAWTWLHMDIRCLVYPAPAPADTTPPPQGGITGQRLSDETGQDDFSDLRAYREGDSPRHIAWQAYARGRGLHTKQFSGQRGSLQWLDWHNLPAQWDIETRLSVLCRQVLTAYQHGDSYGLLLPSSQIAPAQGEAHKHHCLKALALFTGDAHD